MCYSLPAAATTVKWAHSMNENDPNHWCNLSAELRQAGKLGEAAEAAQRALKLDPQCGAALSALAHALRAQGKFAAAKAAAERATQVSPRLASAWFNLGAAVGAMGDAEAGIAAYRRALELDPDYAEAWNNLGNELGERGERDTEIRAYRRALDLKPELAPVWSNLAGALRSVRQYGDAEAACRKAIEIDPAFAPGWSNLGNVLRDLKQYDDSIAACRQALTLAPDLAEAWSNLGNAYEEKGDCAEALRAHRQSIRLDPDNAELHYNLGLALKHCGDPEAAVASYHRALEVKARHGDARCDPGVAPFEQGKYAQALEYYRNAPEALRNLPDLHWNLALALLATGDLEHGWEEYEWRWFIPGWEEKRYDFAQWDGVRAPGRNLLIWAEQGVGDEIIYASMIPELIDSGMRVALEADPRLAPLFRRSFPGVAVVPRQDPSAVDPSRYDCQAPLASLGRWLRPSFSSFPRHAGYLRADPPRAGRYRARLLEGCAPATQVVGISWQSRNEKFGPFKSNALRDWGKILALPRCRFVDLQYGDTADERSAVEAELSVRIAHLSDLDLFHDLDGLAALCAACDRVITVSNVTAHVAGALGRPVWLVAPKAKGKIWYWFADRSDSPWYPSMRIFPQHDAGDWSGVLRDVERVLSAPQT